MKAIVGTLFVVLAFAGCAKDAENTTRAYLEMDASTAQSMVSSAESMCTSAPTSTGAAPSTIDGPSLNVSYSLTSPATTTVGSGDGTVYITGSGTVTVNGTFSGNIVVCGPSVDTISGQQGNIFLSGGDVGTVTAFSGNLAIDNGQVTGAITGSTANIAWSYNGTVTGRTYTGQ